MRSHGSVLMRADTGFGKTVCAAFIANKSFKNKKRLYFICHRQELLLQTAKTFAKNGLPFSYIANGHTYNPMASIQICSIDTLKNRYKKLPIPDLVIWDECAHAGAAGWARVKEYYSDSYHLGLTATPQRLDGKGLGKWFDIIVDETNMAELIKLGYLSDYKIFAPSKPSLSGVHTRMGDYNQAETAAIMDNAHLTGDIVKHWKKLANGMKTVVFAINIEHSMHIVDSFNASGVRAVHIDANTPKAERKDLCIKFAQGYYDVISNCSIFSEGWDIAAQTDIDVTIECVISARPTKSLSMWLQMCGRALRKKDYHAIIIDHASNAMLHGLPCQDREWSLEGDPNQGKKKSDDDVAIKECPKCYAVHKPAPACPNCGHVYEVEVREITHVEGDLQELSKEEVRVAARKEQGGAGSIEELIALGRKRNYKNPAKWAAHIFTARQAKQRQRKAG